MKIEFKETGRWFASWNELDSEQLMKGPYKSKEDAMRTFAKTIKGDTTQPFYVHTQVEVLFIPDALMLIDWLVGTAKSQGIYGLDNFEALKNNPKSVEILNKDLNDALLKAFASVQQTNKVVLKESYRVYPREYLQWVK